jgi:hypothetical protein
MACGGFAADGIPIITNPDDAATALLRYLAESVLNFSMHDAQQK